MTSPSRFTAALMVASACLSMTAPAFARGRLHVGANGSGGTVAAGPNGVAARGHQTTTNPDGSTTLRSAGGFSGVNGANGTRQGSTTVGADGSVSRSGNASASGANGSIATSGGFSRSAGGTWSGSRSTSATNANTGTTYHGSTSIDPATGQPVHTGACTSASGATVACH